MEPAVMTLTEEQYDELRFIGNTFVYRGEYPRREKAGSGTDEKLNSHGKEFAECSDVGRTHRKGPTYGRALDKVAAPI
jgi:hypothetical protein